MIKNDYQIQNRFMASYPPYFINEHVVVLEDKFI